MRVWLTVVLALLIRYKACGQDHELPLPCHWVSEGDTVYLQRPGIHWELKDSLPDGLWGLVSKGRLLERGQYINGKREGVFTYFSYQGDLIKLQSYKAGLLDGPFLIFQSGQVQTSGTYSQGARSGVWYSWDESWKYNNDSSIVLSRKWEIVSEREYDPRSR